MRATGGQILRCIVLVISALATGCRSNFYLSESEVAAYSGNLRSAASSVDLLDNLPDLPLTVEFDPMSPTPQIRRTNLLEVLRGLPELFFLEVFFRQIHLERLSGQVEQEASVWIAERVALFQDGQTRVRLASLERATVRFLAPPDVTYDISQQEMRFGARLELRLTASVEVRDPGGIVGSLVGVFLPDGTFPLSIVIHDFQFQTVVRLSTGLERAGLVRVRVTPSPGAVTVVSQAPDSVREGVRQLIGQRLSSPVEAARLLRYDHFALVDARLRPSARDASTPELTLAYRSRPEGSQPVVDLVIRAADGILHHARKRSDEWGSFAAVPLPRPVATDPVLVSSGPDQLELVAVTADGEVYYAGWRQGAWSNVVGSRPIGGLVYHPATPALVATAPGQLEVVAVAKGGTIWHLRRRDGRWSERSIDYRPAAPPLREPVAVRAANQVVLLYVDARDRLFGAVLDLERDRWSEPFLVASDVGHGPAASPCGDGRVDVAYVARVSAAQEQTLHRVLRVRSDVTGGLATMSAATPVAGPLSTTPTLVCSGHEQIELLGQAGDRLTHNRLLGLASAALATPGLHGWQIQQGWQGWQEVSDSLFGTVFNARIEGRVAAVSTGTGQVHIAVRQRGAAPANIFHNSYDTTRYGRSPPVSVHWRGFEEITDREFSGSPALAIWDRQVEIATGGADGQLWHAALSDSNVARFSRVADSAVGYPVDPIVLRSGTGIVDFVTVRPDGALAHHRRLNGIHDVRPGGPALVAPSRVTFSPAAAVVGDGQIEVVARLADRALYHWRLRGGQWDPPVRIGGDVLSAPALVSLGAGRLALLGLGQDRRLYQWRFDAGRWSGFRQVPGNFNVAAVFFGPQAASSYGDGILDVIVTEDGTGRMFHVRLTGEEWIQKPPGRADPTFIDLGGDAADVPAVTTSASGRVDVLVRFGDGRLYQNETVLPRPLPLRPQPMPTTPGAFPGVPTRRELLSWRGFQPVAPGQLLGPLVRLGDQELVAAFADHRGRIHLSRFAHWRFLVFAPLVGQTEQTYHFPPYRPALSRH